MTNVNDTASAAQTYIDRGWAVVRLYDVSGGLCSCGSDDEPEHSVKAGGKHPIGNGWQNAGIRDPATAREAWARRPMANIGIVTGRVSGIWVLDVDPEHGGDIKLAALVAVYGPLPETWTVQTGSGGRHYYWKMPDFDFTLSRGQLPFGLDVRGNSGQVVAPPSYTLKGDYRILHAGEVADAPGWLLAMIKPPERPEIPDFDPNDTQWTDGFADVDRGSYGQTAVRFLLNELAAALPGTRNETAYRVGRRLAELVNSPWTGLDGEEIFHGFMAAASACNTDGSFTALEAEATLRKAVAGQAGRGVDPPPLPPDMSGTAWTPPVPLPPAPGSAVVSDFDQAGEGPANPFTSPGEVRPLTQGPETSTGVAVPLINGPIEQAKVEVPEAERVSPWEVAVQQELARLLVREEAVERARMRREDRSPIQIMNREALIAMPRAQPLIAGWLGRRQTARLYGPPGSGKSFAAIEMAACIAAGQPWHGYQTHRGEVVYLAVEDAEGVALRLRAWELHHETEHQVHVVSAPVQMNALSVRRILAAIRAYFGDRQLALIVIDTQAMVTIGLDENSAQDMGVFVEAVKLLTVETGATVLTVHHSGVRGGRARGSTSVRGAMDVEIEAAMAGPTCTLSSTKQKNVGAPPAIMATLSVVDVGEVDELGTAITSCVLLAPQDGVSGPFTSPAGPLLSALERRSLAIATALVETAATGETYSRLRIRAGDMTDFGRTPGTVTANFSKAWAHLVGRGRIAKAQGREAFYFIEVEGLDRLAANPFKTVQGGPETYLGEGVEE